MCFTVEVLTIQYCNRVGCNEKEGDSEGKFCVSLRAESYIMHEDL
jgi:hypothetical protein